MEYIKDHEFPIKYYLCKANTVADVLSMKIALVSFLIAEAIWADVFRDMDVELQPLNDRVMLANMSFW